MKQMIAENQPLPYQYLVHQTKRRLTVYYEFRAVCPCTDGLPPHLPLRPLHAATRTTDSSRPQRKFDNGTTPPEQITSLPINILIKHFPLIRQLYTRRLSLRRRALERRCRARSIPTAAVIPCVFRQRAGRCSCRRRRRRRRDCHHGSNSCSGGYHRARTGAAR